MATARETSYLGTMRLLLLLLVLGTTCVVAQEGKSKLRTWTSSIGTKIEAELVSHTGEQVILKTKAGRTLQVPINKLSKPDQEFVAAKSSQAEPAKGEVPVNPNLKYEIKGDAVTITGCDREASGALKIPATIEGKTVTSIGDKAFAFCTSLTSITIGDGVISIGEYAFDRCSSLTSITIPDSVTSIGAKAFYLCTSLASVTIPDGVISIGDNTFFKCKSLTSITIPDSVTSIGAQAFCNCYDLTSITIGNGVTSIEVGAFLDCTSLTSITIPDSVTSIGDAAFWGSTSLTSITFLGDAPKAKNPCDEATQTIYRKPEAKGWGETFAGRPVKLISEKP